MCSQCFSERVESINGNMKYKCSWTNAKLFQLLADRPLVSFQASKSPSRSAMKNIPLSLSFHTMISFVSSSSIRFKKCKTFSLLAFFLVFALPESLLLHLLLLTDDSEKFLDLLGDRVCTDSKNSEMEHSDISLLLLRRIDFTPFKRDGLVF